MADKQLAAFALEIGHLIRLEGLHLDGNQLTALVPEIGNLTNLTDLDLLQNQRGRP